MKIAFNTHSLVSDEQLDRNVASARARGLPRPKCEPRPKLAVVGGGPSLAIHRGELLYWPGDIWACSSAFQWCRKNGIKATFFNVDPEAAMLPWAEGVERAILSTTTDPSLFDAIPEVEAFDLVATADYMNHGVSAVTATPCLALEIGYTDITFFGCDSSYDYVTHAYQNELAADGGLKHVIWVRCGDRVYPTNPPLLMQAEFLGAVVRTCSMVFSERSGGLLGAMARHEDFDIVAANTAMHEKLDITVNGEKATPEQRIAAFPILEIAA